MDRIIHEAVDYIDRNKKFADNQKVQIDICHAMKDRILLIAKYQGLNLYFGILCGENYPDTIPLFVPHWGCIPKTEFQTLIHQKMKNDSYPTVTSLINGVSENIKYLTNNISSPRRRSFVPVDATTNRDSQSLRGEILQGSDEENIHGSFRFFQDLNFKFVSENGVVFRIDTEKLDEFGPKVWIEEPYFEPDGKHPVMISGLVVTGTTSPKNWKLEKMKFLTKRLDKISKLLPSPSEGQYDRDLLDLQYHLVGGPRVEGVNEVKYEERKALAKYEGIWVTENFEKYGCKIPLEMYNELPDDFVVAEITTKNGVMVYASIVGISETNEIVLSNEVARDLMLLRKDRFQLDVRFITPAKANSINVRYKDNSAWQNRLNDTLVKKELSRYEVLTAGSYLPEHKLVVAMTDSFPCACLVKYYENINTVPIRFHKPYEKQ